MVSFSNLGRYWLLVSAIALVAITAASPARSPGAQAKLGVPFDSRHFIAAIQDASVPQLGEIDDHLFALAGGNGRLVWRPGTSRKQLAVVSVMTADTYRSFYKSGSGTTPPEAPIAWVTLAPELAQWCKHLRQAIRENDVALRRRILQRLGLSPTTPYEKVVELWVDRSKVFRPCPDPAVADRSCGLEMEGTPKVKGIADFPAFFASLYVGAYGTEGAPWTRLGYTYDWGGRSEVGASEYMLTTNTHYDVRSAASVADYCRWRGLGRARRQPARARG